jgi:hypothetical protein
MKKLSPLAQLETSIRENHGGYNPDDFESSDYLCPYCQHELKEKEYDETASNDVCSYCGYNSLGLKMCEICKENEKQVGDFCFACYKDNVR